MQSLICIKCPAIWLLSGYKQCTNLTLKKTTTTTVLRHYVQDYLGEMVPEETLTHSHLCRSSIILYPLPPSTVIYVILPVQFMCLSLFCTISVPFSLVYLLVCDPPLHTPYIASPNHCLLFAAHAHTIATCFAVVPKLYDLILVSFSILYLERYLLV